VSERHLKFSAALPLISLGCWVTLVLVPTTLLFLHMKSRADGAKGFTFRGATVEATIPPNDILPFAIQGATSHTARVIAAMNIPAFFVEILISLPTTWPQTLYPSGFLLESWRALVFPIYALPAWWCAGRNLDGLLGHKRPGIVEVTFNSFVAIAFVVLGLGLRFGLSSSERDSDIVWYSCGLVLWAVLAGIAPASWLWRRRTTVSRDREVAG
jgi:hypothetical protein